MDWYISVSNLYLSHNILLLFDLRNQLTSSNFQHTMPSTSTYTQQFIVNIQQPFKLTQSHYISSQHYHQQYPSFNLTPYNKTQFYPLKSYIQQQTPSTTHYNKYLFTKPTSQERKYPTPQPQILFGKQIFTLNSSEDLHA